MPTSNPNEKQLPAKRLRYFMISGVSSAVLAFAGLAAGGGLLWGIVSIICGLIFALALNRIRPHRPESQTWLFVIIFTVVFALFTMGLIRPLAELVSQSGSSFIFAASIIGLTGIGAVSSILAGGGYENFMGWSTPPMWKLALAGGIAFAIPHLITILLYPYGIRVSIWFEIPVLLLSWNLAVGWLFSQNTQEDLNEHGYIKNLIEEIGKDE
ncbi:MAG: hypothetical protein AB8F95_18340 [Bacteroidia bacterium]